MINEVRKLAKAFYIGVIEEKLIIILSYKIVFYNIDFYLCNAQCGLNALFISKSEV